MLHKAYLKKILAIVFLVIFFVFLFIFFRFSRVSQKLEKRVVQIKEQIRGGKDPVVVAVGDIACDSLDQGFGMCRHIDTSDLVLKINPDAVLLLGDLQYPSATLELLNKYYDSSWGRFKEKTRPTLGNHDYVNGSASGYFDYFNGVEKINGVAGKRNHGYYSFDIGTWHIIVLNSNCWAVDGCTYDSPQGIWLQNDLAENNSKCTLAYMHHPRFSSGEHGETAYLDTFWQILAGRGVDILLSAHDHVYERFAPKNREGKGFEKGMRQFVVGTGGRSLYSFNQKAALQGEARNNADFGVLKLTLHKDSYEWEFITSGDGSFLDKGSAYCN